MGEERQQRALAPGHCRLDGRCLEVPALKVEVHGTGAFPQYTARSRDLTVALEVSLTRNFYGAGSWQPVVKPRVSTESGECASGLKGARGQRTPVPDKA